MGLRCGGGDGAGLDRSRRLRYRDLRSTAWLSIEVDAAAVGIGVAIPLPCRAAMVRRQRLGGEESAPAQMSTTRHRQRSDDVRRAPRPSRRRCGSRSARRHAGALRHSRRRRGSGSDATTCWSVADQPSTTRRWQRRDDVRKAPRSRRRRCGSKPQADGVGAHSCVDTSIRRCLNTEPPLRCRDKPHRPEPQAQGAMRERQARGGL